MAFGFVPRDAADGIVSTLAVEHAAIAVVAGGVTFFEAEDGPAGGNAKKGAEWADGAAPEASYAEVEKKNKDEKQAQEETLTEVRLLEAEDGGVEQQVNYADEKLERNDDRVGDGIERGVNSVVCGGKKGESEGADEEGKGVEPADET